MHSALRLLGIALVSCNGSIASSPALPAGDAGHAESGPASDGGGAQEACSAEPFDAGAYALDGGDAGALIGTPCLPGAESSPTFDGFASSEINFRTGAASGAPICFIYYFQGLVTCPYGQNAGGQGPSCASPCTTSTGQPVTAAVLPQCADRPASKTVLWSCRCANALGGTDDGDAYCSCPSGLACTQAIPSIGASEDDYSGAYCLPPAIVRDGGSICSVVCDPTTAPCP